MLGWLGYGIPFSYLGPAIAFIVFSITLLIICGVRDIIGHCEIPW